MNDIQQNLLAWFIFIPLNQWVKYYFSHFAEKVDWIYLIVLFETSVLTIPKDQALQNHRTSRFGRQLWWLFSPFPHQGRVMSGRLHRNIPRWNLNVSREGDFMVCLGSPFQCSVALHLRKFFLMLRWNFLCFSYQKYFNKQLQLCFGTYAPRYSKDI